LARETVGARQQPKKSQSQVNEVVSKICHLWRFAFPIEPKALFSQAFRLTFRAAGKSADESAIRFYDPPISDLVGGIMGNGLNGLSCCNRARPADVELLGEYPANEIRSDKSACWHFLYQRRHGRWTRQEHFARAPKKTYALPGDVDDGVFFGLHIGIRLRLFVVQTARLYIRVVLFSLS
jgi:hypothetical protein